MKVGDIVKFTHLSCKEWGGIALIYKIFKTDYGTGQIYLINHMLPGSTIPWATRDKYAEVISESR